MGGGGEAKGGERSGDGSVGGEGRAGIVAGRARGIAGGHPPRCGSEGLKCSRAAKAHTWRVLRLNTAERHPELAPTDDIAVATRARAAGRVRREGGVSRPLRTRGPRIRPTAKSIGRTKRWLRHLLRSENHSRAV